MRLRIFGMQGMWPRVSPRLLTDRQAQIARNCKLYSGEIRPLRDPVQVISDIELSGIGTQSIWRWHLSDGQSYWFRFPSDVDAVRGPVSGDVWQRVYFTGDSRYDEPRYTYTPVAYQGGSDYPVTSYKLGVPAPESPIATDTVEPEEVAIDDIVTTERPISVVTTTPHGFSNGDVVRFSIESDDSNEDHNSLSEYLNAEEGFNVSVINDTAFSLDHTDGQNIDYTPFVSGTVTVYYEPGERETRFYVFTYVTNLGEEGPPSPASDAAEVGTGQPIDLTLPMPEVDANSGRVLETRRVYRSVTGSSGAEFQFLAELDIAEDTFRDQALGAGLGEFLQSDVWDPPPAAMRGLQVTPNGMGVGFVDQDVCFSEPYRLHAWPSIYRVSVDYPVVALGVFDTSVVVATEGRPYLLTGTDPRSIQPRRLEVNQACVSKRSMVSLGYAAVYASPDGLVLVGGSGARVVTQGYMTAQEWAAYAPETIHAYEVDGRYIGFYDNGQTKGGFVFDPREPELGFVEVGFYAKAGHRDPREPYLYLLTEDHRVVRWDTGAHFLTFLWRSRVMPTVTPVNMSAAQVIAQSYHNLTFRLYADGALKDTVSVTGREPFRLPAGYRGSEWEVEVEGTDTVNEIVMAESVSEMRQP